MINSLELARRIVHHDMHVKAIRNVTFDLVEEFAELLRPVARHIAADHGACPNPRLRVHGSDETREERGRAMTFVVVRAVLAVKTCVCGIHSRVGDL